MYSVQPVVAFQCTVGRARSAVTSREVTTSANGIRSGVLVAADSAALSRSGSTSVDEACSVVREAG